MQVYTERPRPRRARQVWDHFAKANSVQPAKLWKNPNCWGGPRQAGNMWGWWVCELPNGRVVYDIPQAIPNQSSEGSDVDTD